MKIKHQAWNNARCGVFKTTYDKDHAAANAIPTNMNNQPDKNTAPQPRKELKSGHRARCVECKGRLWCGLQSCPLLDRVAIQKPLEATLGREVFGPSPPNIFAGWQGYPQVFVGPLVAYREGDDAAASDNPSDWYGYNFSKIIEMRASLVRGMKKTGVKQKDRFVSDLQDVVMSVKTVDLEVAFKSVPKFSMSFSPVSQPMGPSAALDEMRVVDNPAIPKKVDSLVQEDLTVREALPELIDGNFDYYYLQKLLTAGVLGKKDARKIVPTRWSITAADRMVADFHIEQLKELPEIGEIRVYSNEYLYNHFEILLLPGKWEFEQFESWAPGTIWTQGDEAPHISHEYEPFGGRSDYAETEGGGYYAGRLGVAEALAVRLRRQARVIVFREIYEGYKMPVGVWSLREGVRHAFEDAPARFDTIQDALKHLRTKLKHSVTNYLLKSRILSQKKITDYW